MSNQRWQDWVTALAGLWLLASPFLLPAMGSAALTGLAFWNQIIFGIAILALGLAALYAYRVWEEPVDAILGLWVIVSPWVLGFGDVTAFAYTNVVAGLVVLVFAGWMTYEHSHDAA